MLSGIALTACAVNKSTDDESVVERTSEALVSAPSLNYLASGNFGNVAET